MISAVPKQQEFSIFQTSEPYKAKEPTKHAPFLMMSSPSKIPSNNIIGAVGYERSQQKPTPMFEGYFDVQLGSASKPIFSHKN
jgi:hypothetical protein